MSLKNWQSAHDAVHEALNQPKASTEQRYLGLMALGEVHLGAEKYDEAVRW